MELRGQGQLALAMFGDNCLLKYMLDLRPRNLPCKPEMFKNLACDKGAGRRQDCGAQR